MYCGIESREHIHTICAGTAVFCIGGHSVSGKQGSQYATPAIIFPRLTQLAQAHLRKLSVAQKIWYEQQLVALHEKLPEVLPARLSLAEQESFFIGYYHQTQKRFEKKEKADSVKEEENDA